MSTRERSKPTAPFSDTVTCDNWTSPHERRVEGEGDFRVKARRILILSEDGP